MGERGQPPRPELDRGRWTSPRAANGKAASCGAIDAITRHRLRHIGLDADALEDRPVRERMDLVHAHFVSRVPFENLSRRRSCLRHPEDPAQWPRPTDRFLRDHRAAGLGGTSFALTYALRDLLAGIGANAHCALGRNLVTEEALAAVLVYVRPGEALLYAPALLLREPLPVRPGATCQEPFGSVRFEAREGEAWVVSLTLKDSVRPRPLCSLLPVPIPPQRFRKAWLASFARGRPRPLELARRCGGEIRRYRQQPSRLEIVSERGRERRPLRGEPAAELHDLFGIDEACLREWFEREAG